MDRQINYVRQVLYEKDMLKTNKFGYVSLSRIFDAIVGKNTVLNRLDCVPNSPQNLSVNVETGEIYFAEETDSTPYGSLPVDTTEIVKQGIFPSTVNFLTPAPAGSGNSINYLIEFKFETADEDPEGRPYFNSASPPNPDIITRNNLRVDKCLAQIITGVEAPTGTQVTPPVSVGWTGGWVITVDFGDTAVNDSAISKYPGTLFIEERLLDLASPNKEGNENIILGGNFDTNPWQRGTSKTGIIAYHHTQPGATSYQAPDRFGIFDDGATPSTGEMKVTRVLDAPTLAQSGIFTRYSAEYEVTTAQASIDADKLVGITYHVEGKDFAQVAQKETFFSVWVKTNKAGTYSLGFQNRGGLRVFNTAHVLPAGSWVKLPINVDASPAGGTWDYDNDRGLTISIYLAGGSGTHTSIFNQWTTASDTNSDRTSTNQVNFLDTIGNKFAIQLVKLEPGNVETPWKPENIGNLLANEERYAEKSYQLSVFPEQVTTDFITLFQTVTGPQAHNIQYRTRKRPAVVSFSPTNVQVYSPSAGTAGQVDVNGTPTAATAVSSDESQMTFTVNATAGDVITFNYFADSEIT